MVIRRLSGGRWRIYSRKFHDGRRLNLGTYETKGEAVARERQLARFRRKK